MKRNSLSNFIFLLFLFFHVNIFALEQSYIFENAEDGKIDRWTIVKNKQSSKVINTSDKEKNSKVIEFKGLGLKSAYEIAINSTENRLQLDINVKNNFYLEFAVESDKGLKYLSYTPQNSDYLGTGNFIRHGLGTKILDGKWHTITFDLQKDLQDAQKGVEIKKVVRFRVYGDLKLDNLQTPKKEQTPITDPKPVEDFRAEAFGNSIHLYWKQESALKYKLYRDSKLINILDNGKSDFLDQGLKPDTLYKYQIISFNDKTESKPVSLKIKTKKIEIPDNEAKETLYEDAQDGTVKGWSIYDAYPFGAKIENVFDKNRGSRVIKLSGSGLGNGYWLKNSDNRRWHNTKQFIMQIDFNFEDSFIFYIEVKTNKGTKYLTYIPSLSTTSMEHKYQKYLIFGLGEGLTDGKWHTFNRNLETDLASLLPDTKILAIEGVMIRGSGMVDDIKLIDKQSFSNTPLAEPSNLSATTTAESVILKWQDNSSKKVDYRIYRDSKLIATYTKKDSFTYKDSDLLPNTTYTYKITSFLNSTESKGVEVTAVTKEKTTGHIYYVATNGNDMWSGLYDSPKDDDGPWKTIQHAVNMAKAGDTVMVRGGTYPERVVFKNSGNAKDGYITFRNYPGEKPVITRNDRTISDTVVGYGVSYIKFIGFHIYKPNRGGLIFYGPGEHIIIKNNEISESNANIPESKRLGHALNVTARKNKPMSYITIENNHVHHNHTGNPNKAGAYNEALTVLGNVKYFKIINNEINNNDFIGLDVIGHQRGSFSVFGMNKYGLIANNKIYENGVRKVWASALYVDGAENLIVENNLVYDNHGLGITISQETTESTTDYVIVRNNIGWNNVRGGMIGSANRGTVRNSVFVHNLIGNSSAEADLFLGNAISWRIKNNIFSGEGRAPFLFKDLSRKTGSWIMDNNIYKDVAHIVVGKSYTSFSSYQSGSGKDKNSFLVTDLYFKDKANYDFHLTANSEAVDRGGFLTTTKSSGKGSVIPVYDAVYFTDGYTLKEGDLVQIGDNEPVFIDHVDYSNNTISVKKEISWNKGDGVSYVYNGSAPDIGPFEYQE